MYSMTGYGKAETVLPTKKIVVEIKSLNSKQTDLFVRIPTLYRPKEVELRNLVSKRLLRGKIELFINSEKLVGESIPRIASDVLINYYNQLAACSKQLHHAPIGDLSSLLRLPEVMQESKNHELTDEEWTAISETVDAAITQLQHFRLQEGESLFADIASSIEQIIKLEAQVTPYEESRIVTVRQKLQQALSNINTPDIEHGRLEQELLFYAEKYDLNEERVRLKNHCNYFLQEMKQDGQVGKKLGFIAQEIGREINTLGSKANHMEIQKIVVQMKEELEKIKEQTLNVL